MIHHAGQVTAGWGRQNICRVVQHQKNETPESYILEYDSQFYE